jgi:hypothetical protein
MAASKTSGLNWQSVSALQEAVFDPKSEHLVRIELILP